MPWCCSIRRAKSVNSCGVNNDKNHRSSVINSLTSSTLITPILINSGYRSKAVNDAVGSHDGSQHRLGCAADIRVTNRTPEGLMLAIYESKLQYDQLLLEFADGKGGGWVHISIPNVAGGKPRRQALKIGRGGTFVYP